MSRTTRTNAERSATTRAAVLDATVEAIVRYGYKGATSTRIAELSGLTRGAQIHHFNSKEEMVIEAILHLHSLRDAQLDEILRTEPSGDPLENIVETTWRSFQGELWVAVAELWTVARTDDGLRDALIPAEQTISARIRRQTLPLLAAVPGFSHLSPARHRAILGLIIASSRGAALRQFIEPNERRSRAQRKELVAALQALAEAESTAD